MTKRSHHQTLGVLITNLGTPEAPTPIAVRRYLAQFLWDPHVVQISRPLWWLILYGLILPIRSRKSAKLYQKIWTSEGSPLLTLSQSLVNKTEQIMQDKGYGCHYAFGMRYGNPSLKDALISLREKQIKKLILMPLYPQYSSTTTASTYVEVQTLLQAMNWDPELYLVHDYAQAPSYIDAIAKSIQTQWEKTPPAQHMLFSFHGIPKRLVNKGDPYLEQCLATASEVAKTLNLNPKRWQVVFQSRFGKESWLQPYCNKTLQQLAQNNIKTVDIVCPGFPVDCLETLEEIAITNQKVFQQAGGTHFNYIPALNDSTPHGECLSNILINFFDKYELI